MAQTRTLQARYLRRAQTVNAGTAQATPTNTPWSLGNVMLDSITVRVPPGPSGLVGLAVLYSGVPVLPSDQPGVFFVGEDEEWEFDIGVEVSGPLTLQMYNTDIYPHTLYLTAKVRDISVLLAGAATAGATVVSSIPGGPGPSDQEIAGAVAVPPPEEEAPPPPASVGPVAPPPAPSAPSTPTRYGVVETPRAVRPS